MLQKDSEGELKMLNNHQKRVILANRSVMRVPAGRPRVRSKLDKYGYDQQYLKENIQTVGVTFNKRKPDDMVLLDWLNNRSEKKVAYIKRLIREDMEKFT